MMQMSCHALFLKGFTTVSVWGRGSFLKILFHAFPFGMLFWVAGVSQQQNSWALWHGMCLENKWWCGKVGGNFLFYLVSSRINVSYQSAQLLTPPNMAHTQWLVDVECEKRRVPLCPTIRQSCFRNLHLWWSATTQRKKETTDTKVCSCFCLFLESDAGFVRVSSTFGLCGRTKGDISPNKGQK